MTTQERHNIETKISELKAAKAAVRLKNLILEFQSKSAWEADLEELRWLAHINPAPKGEYDSAIKGREILIRSADADHEAFCKLLAEGVLHKQDWKGCRATFLYDILCIMDIYYFRSDADEQRAIALLPYVEEIEIDLHTGVVSPTDKKLWEKILNKKPLKPCGGDFGGLPL